MCVYCYPSMGRCCSFSIVSHTRSVNFDWLRKQERLYIRCEWDAQLPTRVTHARS